MLLDSRQFLATNRPAPPERAARRRWLTVAAIGAGLAMLLVLIGVVRSGDDERRPAYDSEALEIARGPSHIAMSTSASGPQTAAVAPKIPIEEIRNDLVVALSGDEAIGFEVTSPGKALKQAGFRAGDMLTYVGDEAMSAGQSPDEIQRQLQPGATVSVSRDGGEVQWVLP